MLIDEYLPKYDVSNKYAVTVDAPPERVFEVVHRLDISSAEISMLLFRLRGLAGWESEEKYDIDRIQKAGFVILGEDPSQEFLLGLIGKPWSPTGELVDFTAEEFAEFDKPGLAKIVWNFTVKEVEDGKTLLETETRILNTDEDARWKFGIYWFFVSSFSGLTRHEILHVLKNQAERPLLPDEGEIDEEDNSEES